MSVMRKVAAGAAGSLMLVGAVAVPSDAARNTTFQDGLVNVNVGDVTVSPNVAVGVAANVVAQVCGVSVGPVGPIAILATVVDRTGVTSTTICTATGGAVTGPVTITQLPLQ